MVFLFLRYVEIVDVQFKIEAHVYVLNHMKLLWDFSCELRKTTFLTSIYAIPEPLVMRWVVVIIIKFTLLLDRYILIQIPMKSTLKNTLLSMYFHTKFHFSKQQKREFS